MHFFRFLGPWTFMFMKAAGLHRNDVHQLLNTPPQLIEQGLNSEGEDELRLIVADDQLRVFVFVVAPWDDGAYDVINIRFADDDEKARYVEMRTDRGYSD